MTADAPPPRLADSVTIDEPIAPGDPWILSVAGVPRARVGSAAASFAARLDGRSSPNAAETDLTSEESDELLRALAAAGLLAGSERREPRARLLQFRPPASLQLTLLDATRPATAIARLLRPRGVRILALGAVCVVLTTGAVSAALHADEIVAVLGEPLPVRSLIVVAVAFLLSGALHEAGHAVALARAGGRPRRAGLMLFYFAPAFFCDVTDGWRLGDRRARAVIALTGPAVHLVLAGIAATALFVPGTDRSALACFVVAAALGAATNLIPFVHLDGYLALVALTDRPFLRASAARSVTDLIIRILGGDAPRASARLVAFGIGCRLFPVLLLGWGYVRAEPVLALTVPGAVIALLLAAALLGMLVAGARRFVIAARRAHVRPGRAVAGLLLLAATIAAASAVPLTERLPGGYVVRDGAVHLVLTAELPISIGDAVELASNGIALHRPQTTATVVGPATPTMVPVAALAPVAGLGAAPGTGYRLDAVDPTRLDDTGYASVVVGRTSLGAAVIDLVAGDAVRRLGVGR
ncbi:M50 family metallopeptidase [Microbacteriaceae bacterium VKM Ac-2855]|nr:M50 family metallopeptidase [Microbacteriaceae bacterium VKM Ac-2855]